MSDTNPTTPPCTNPDCADAKGVAAALDHQTTRLDKEITRLNREITRLTRELATARNKNRDLTRHIAAAEPQRDRYPTPDCNRLRDNL